MGWKGTVRSIRAAARRAERDARRRQRELERWQKEQQRITELEEAAFEVEQYENYLDVLQSAHKECGPQIDWRAMVGAPEPAEPKRLDTAERAARDAESSYEPGFLDRLLKREGTRRAELAVDVERAREMDDSAFRQASADWRREHQEWKDNRSLAVGVLASEPKALIEAIRAVDPFSDLDALGTSIGFQLEGAGPIEATIRVHSETVIPTEVKSLLRSGRLSVKTMPKGRFYELFQDYVCSCVLRVANELFALLPIRGAIVTAEDALLDTSTGHLEEVPILSTYLARETLEHLDLENIDPSDSMKNFIHRMRFKKTQGFQGIERLTPGDLAVGIDSIST
ncbi:MAG: hypothetical protein AAGN66_08165 [Acidobacteriota bacterium]